MSVNGESSITETQALQKIPSTTLSRPTSFAPSSMTEALAFSDMIANSDLAPKDYKGRPGNVLIAMQMGAEVGLSPMQAIQNIAVINGRPSLWGDSALAVVQAHPAYEWHKEWIEGEGINRTAVFQIQRRGNPLHEARFSKRDAQLAGLLDKDIWKKYPDRMLQMRARGFGMRDKFADALRGLNIAEEAMDSPAIDAPFTVVETPQQQLPQAVAMPRRLSAPAEPPTPAEVVEDPTTITEADAQALVACPSCGETLAEDGCHFCGWMPEKEEHKEPEPPAAPQRQTPPPQVQRPRPPQGEPISEPQRKRFFAIAMGNGKTKQDQSAYLQSRWGISSDKEIVKGAMYEECVKWAQGN